ncbi:hypothetical protein MYAM1_002605 [Malassezia yamatoensis]|uniref:Enoyl reductase (ER) domain-containing protein n=1 Tax=Malassezia yamatoensis TaxID=253288 RepID=A0AAJ5YSX6_9BASI|nr:hypothetical protein MYAM1_002605 [Malassezia yamatoensis]
MPSADIPQKMTALVVQDKGEAELEQIDTPNPPEGGVMVKVQNVALNPTDWKHLDWVGSKGAIVGSDFCGSIVDDCNETETGMPAGTRVAGMVRGGYQKGVGAFAEYVSTYPATLIKVPDNVPSEEAAGLGVGGFTSYCCLFQDKHLNLAAPSASLSQLPEVDSSKKILIWSGSTSVGQFAIQFARAAGYYVIVTASSKHEQYLKGLGAQEVYDYKQSDAADKIAEKHPDLVYALDTYSIAESQTSCARALSKSQSSTLTTILPPSEEVSKVNDKVKQTFFLGYTLGGQEFEFFGKSFSKEYCQEDQKFLISTVKSNVFTNYLQNKILKCNRTSPQSGGLGAVHFGFDRMRKGEVSCEKLTYQVA